MKHKNYWYWDFSYLIVKKLIRKWYQLVIINGIHRERIIKIQGIALLNQKRKYRIENYVTIIRSFKK